MFKSILKTVIYALLISLGATAFAAEEEKLDAIVAIVDESVITERELEARTRLVMLEFSQTERQLPRQERLKQQVLESLIIDSLLIQEAERRGIRITDSRLNQAMQRLARQNNMSLSDYRRALLGEGIDYEKYRETIRQEIMLNTLQRQYGQRNVTISDAEVDDFLSQSEEGEISFEYQLSHILIAIPDGASPEAVSEAQSVAADILSQLELGAAFDQLANDFSAGDRALQGGDLGWRKKAQIPSLFTEAVLAMEPGDHAGPIRSASGLHIVHLKQRRDLEQVIVEQFRSRHILIKPNELIDEEEARNRLAEFRQRILDGEDFGRLARLYSVDYVSGSSGGDIGWQNPRATVPVYESTVRDLELGEISQPFRTRHGWHIAELTALRSVDETAQTKRDKIYAELLQQKQQEAFDLWKRRLRDKAYVVYPDKPDA